ncbi:MAG: PBP1A family penicillin-binding protein [Deltaproteobacteria bacterium]|nr:PBP1A family penicillin-binding protein [Deltaproteobacteria bacterium]
MQGSGAGAAAFKTPFVRKTTGYGGIPLKLRRSHKFIIAVLLWGVAVGLAGYFYFTRGLPNLESIEDYHPELVTKAYSADGRIIGEFYVERRVVVPFSRIPKHLAQAFLAAEDARFYEHEGISYTSILRAMYKNMMAGKVVQGGSTITQQVAKSFFLSSERKLGRKIREAIMAVRIENNLTKDEILSLYLNQIYMGNGAYGVQSAAETYFGKDVSRLTVAESAMLASLPKAPSKYSPFASLEAAKRRQEFVLSRMVEEGFLTLEAATKAAKERIVLAPKSADSLWVGPYFTEHVRRYVEERYGGDALYKGGLTVYTTLDVEAQRAANEAVNAGLREYDKRHGYRGPAAVLKTREEIDAFRAEADKRLSGNGLKAGGIYQAVAMGFNAKDSSLNVDIGSRRGVVAKQDMEWARLYNPTDGSDGGTSADVKKTIHPGAVVEVMVKSLPAAASAPVPVTLEQEPKAQAALLAMEPSTGYVRAMVGGAEFGKSQFNRAVQAVRQPGSAFKPIIYTAAMDNNYTPATVVVDSPLVFDMPVVAKENGGEDLKDQWRPKNYDDQFNGPTTVREAVAKSRNVVAIKVLKGVGVDNVISYARLMGINSPLSRDLSLALGSSGVTLMEMTTAFSTLANMGARPTPVFITKIVDSGGRVLEENAPAASPVVSPQTAFIMTSLLQGVIENGTGQRAKALGRPAAGKTGTTNDLNDAWFFGYVPDLVAGTWIGYDDERELGHHETGAAAALPIWLRFMKGATANMPVKNFHAPDGVEFVKIDAKTGLLPTAATESAIFEVFKTGTAPVAGKTIRETPGTDFFLMDTGSNVPARRETAPQAH